MARFILTVILLVFSLNAAHSVARAGDEIPPPTPEPVGEYFSSEVMTLSDGSPIEKISIIGPPTPPLGVERLSASTEEIQQSASAVLLNVPAFNWYMGCSATSASMIAAYYDRNGYANMYTGPTNGGVMPSDGSVWGLTPPDAGSDSYYQVPLTASRSGLDGRSARGSFDDYWVSYFSSAPDPFIGNWAEHTYGDAVGDYMRTSQSTYKNVDGSTSFYEYSIQSPEPGAPLMCDIIDDYYLDDGSVGRRLFYQARGYTVTECYNQKADTVATGGFSFAQYMAEIDAGRPVFLNLTGHSIVGIGYDSALNRVYLNDTWNFTSGTTHYMTWGGTYSGMSLEAVSMVTLAPLTQPLTVSKDGTGSGTVSSEPAGIDCGSDCTEGYAPGTVVKLTATASPGSLFTGWNGEGCSGLKFCYVTMSTARTVSASFTTIPPGTYPLTVVKGGTGSGTATSLPAGISCGTDCWEFYTAGTAVRLSAAASPGSTFIGWSGACGSLDYCWLGMGASKYVTANFALTPAGTYPLLVAMKGKGTGTVTSNVPGISCWPDCYEFYTSGTLVRLAAVAAPGSTFTGWSGGCGGTAYCWVTMSQSRFVTANWVLNTASIPPLEADLALFRDPFAFFTFLTKPLEALLP